MGIDLVGDAKRLFDEVCKLVGGDNAFPPDEPSDARALGVAWGNVASILEGAIGATNGAADGIFGNWPDSAGYEYHAAVTGYNSDLGSLITSCRELAAFCEQYAQDVEQQRMATRIEMIINAASFALAFTGGGAIASMFVRKLAAQVTKRVLAAVGRTAASARTRSALTTVSLNVAKEITVEGLEEAVISGGSQLAAQAAGYNPDGIDPKRLATDTLAGGIGGALGYGPGKVVNGVIKPKGVVGQHASALVSGAGVNAVTSPVASVAAQDVMSGEFSGFGEYGASIRENAVDAARMGAVRANGTVLAGQVGTAVGLGTPATPDLPAGTGAGAGGPDGPPPYNTPASVGESVGGAGSTVDSSVGVGEQGVGAGSGAGSAGVGSESGAGSGAPGTSQSSQSVLEAAGAEGPGQVDEAGHGKGAAESGTSVADPAQGGVSAETGAGSVDSAREGVSSESGAGLVDSARGGVSAESGAGSVDSAQGGVSAESGTGRSAEGTGGVSIAGDLVTGEPQAVESGTAGQTMGATGVPGAMIGPSGTAVTRNETAASAPPPPAKASTVAESPDSQRTKGSTATQADEPAQACPVGISQEAWQRLSPPVRDSVSEVFAQKTTRQSVQNAVARLVEVGAPETTVREIVAMVEGLHGGIVTALAEIAERAPCPEALEAAVTLAGERRLGANQKVRKIRDLVRQGSPELDGYLRELGATPTNGQPPGRPAKPGEVLVRGVRIDAGSGLIAPPGEGPVGTPEVAQTSGTEPVRVDAASGVIAPLEETGPQPTEPTNADKEKTPDSAAPDESTPPESPAPESATPEESVPVESEAGSATSAESAAAESVAGLVVSEGSVSAEPVAGSGVLESSVPVGSVLGSAESAAAESAPELATPESSVPEASAGSAMPEGSVSVGSVGRSATLAESAAAESVAGLVVSEGSVPAESVVGPAESAVAASVAESAMSEGLVPAESVAGPPVIEGSVPVGSVLGSAVAASMAESAAAESAPELATPEESASAESTPPVGTVPARSASESAAVEAGRESPMSELARREEVAQSEVGPGEFRAPPREPLLPADFYVPGDQRAAALDAIAQAALREADRRAGLASVTPPSAGRREYQLTTPNDLHLTATAHTADLGNTVAARFTVDGDAVHITVSTRATPASVPTLVAAALGEAVAQLSGVDADLTDRLVRGSTGDPTLSRRDHGRAAMLLDYAHTLAQNPHHLSTRSRLTALIRDLGLDPHQDGAAARLAALPDERMRDVVRQHTNDPDGLLGTLWYLAKSVGAAVPVPVSLGIAAAFGVVPVPVVAAVAAAALARALVQGLYDRSLVVRENAAAGEQLAGRRRQLKDQAKAGVGLDVLRVVAAVKSTSDEDVTRVAPPSEQALEAAPPTLQLERIHGLRRGAGALGGTVALGVVMAVGVTTPLLGPVPALAAAGIFAGTLAPAVVGTVTDAMKKRYTMSWKADRTNTLLTEAGTLVTRHQHEISGHAGDFVEAVRYRLASTARAGHTPGVDGRRFAVSDDVPSHLIRTLLPRAKGATDPDRAGLAAMLSLTQEYGGFRVASAATAVAANLATGGRQFTAEQEASFARERYDRLREADRDIAATATAIANVLGVAAPALSSLSPNEDRPLANDPDRPSPLPDRRWLAMSVAAGLLAVGVAATFELVLGMPALTAVTAAGAVGAPADALATRALSTRGLKPSDRKAELDRTAAQDTREQFVTAITEFATDALGHGTPRRREPTGDATLDEILAARDEAYRSLVDEASRLTDDENASFADLATTVVDRVVTLREVATQAEQLARLRDGQPRAEVAARNGLIAAIQSHNTVPGVTPLPVAGLFDGVHAATTGHTAPTLPTLPADVDGQTAAVTLDRHFRDPDTPFRAPADLKALAGNEGWAARVADAAGVPGGQFRPVDAINDVVGRLEQLGEGSRAIVHARRTDDNGVAESGDLVNAVNLGGTVHFLDAVSGALADVTGYSDGLSMLVTEDNGEHARLLEGRPVVAATERVTGLARGGYQDRVTGSLVTDPAAPGLPEPPRATDLPTGLARIASVINPALGNELPRFRAFSDQWDRRGDDSPPVPPTKLLAGLGTVRATAGLAAAMLATFGDADTTDTPEYRRLDDLLGQEEIQPSDLVDAMTDLMEALLTSTP